MLLFLLSLTMKAIPTSVFYKKAEERYIVLPAGDQSDASFETDEEKETLTPDYEGGTESAFEFLGIGLQMKAIPTSVFYKKAEERYIVLPAGDQSDASFETDEEKETLTPDYEGGTESAFEFLGIGLQVGYTSAPGQGGILAQREFDRRFSPHYLDWAAFGVMTLPSIGIPLLLWYSSKRKYDTPKPKKN
ncbi:UNVERIFIED_CONTAM: hypothetical protein FKN15_031136 [Acipenser sinensis]